MANTEEKLPETVTLMDAHYFDDSKKSVTLTFLTKDRTLRNFRMSLQRYDETKPKKERFVDDAKKAEETEKFAKDFFNCEFNQLENIVGTKFDMYVYPKFITTRPLPQPEKFDKTLVGKVIPCHVTSIFEDGHSIKCRYTDDKTGKLHESKWTYATYFPNMKEWFEDPERKDKQYGAFKETFGTDLANSDTLIGSAINVIVDEFEDSTFGKISKLG